MRARNLKPGIFKNEVLGTGPELGIAFFMGLIAQADRKGIVEDRPLRIRAETFPYRFDVDANALLDFLVSGEFITRYESFNGKKLIHITNFTKHQNPHRDEKESPYLTPMEQAEALREPRGISCDPLGIPGGSREIQQGSPAESGIPVSLNPDSRSTESGITSTPIHRSAERDSSGAESAPRGQVQDVDFLAGQKPSAKPSMSVSEAQAHPVVRAVVDAWRDICTPKGSVFQQPSPVIVAKNADDIIAAAEADPTWLPRVLEVIAWAPRSDFNAGRVAPLKEGDDPFVLTFPGLTSTGLANKKYAEMQKDVERKALLAKAAARQVHAKSKDSPPGDALTRREKARKEKAERTRLADEAEGFRDVDEEMDAARLAAESWD